MKLRQSYVVNMNIIVDAMAKAGRLDNLQIIRPMHY